MNSEVSSIAIPSEILQKWQRIVDLLASIMDVPSAVVTALEPPHCTYYTTVVSSDSKDNPFPVDQTFSMDIGTYCETVIKSREPLLVTNALDDDQWTSAPELGVGMVSYLGFPVSWPDGRVFGTICVLDDKANRYSDSYQELLSHFRDVLEGDLRILAHLGSELEEQKAQLGELFARVPEAVVLADGDATIIRVNPEFTKLFGYPAEEAIGQRLPDLIAPDDLPEVVERQMPRVIQAGDVLAVETLRRRKDGIRVPVSLLCVPLSSGAGGGLAYVIYRDVTETRRLQDEERRYHELQLELAHAHRIATMGQLSASIAHELNQPLTGIITNCSTCLRMLAGDPPNLDGARETVRRAMRDGNRAADVIARLRALFSGREAAAESVDLNESTREVIELSSAALAKAAVSARTDLADDLPLVTGDRVQLQQVVLNLLLNAIEAMNGVADRPKQLVIRTSRWKDNGVCVSVRDVGVGFEPHAIDRLFDPFYTTKHDGMGMGLSVSRSIIEAHHGRLWAAPNDGPGVTFSFAVPCGAGTGSE